MAKDTEKVTLGVGDLYLNTVDVGHLKGDVEFTYSVEKTDFKPSNMLGVVKQFFVGESAALRASLAELKAANIRLAMGMTTAVSTNSSFPAYDPSSYVVPSGSSYDVLHFGGETESWEYSLRFEHTREDGKKIIIVLYKAVSATGLTLPFHETDINIQDVEFRGLADATRTKGDQIGFLAEQVTSA